ncbi:MAG: hypothetical protein ACFFBP_09645 [Promethearchaeota archaeon]
MILSREEIQNKRKQWQNSRNANECPICHKKIEVDIDLFMMEKILENKSGVYPHLVLHGNPLHGMIIYIDKHMNIRSVSSIESMEISKDSETCQQLLEKCPEPY